MSEKKLSIKEKIIDGLIIAGLLFLIQTGVNYFLQAKQIKSKSEIENLYSQKQSTYFEAIDLINSYLSNDTWAGKDIPKNFDKIKLVSKEIPDMIAVNNCYAKLVLFSENEEIFDLFSSFFNGSKNKEATTIRLGKLMNLMRKDLGHKEIIVNPLNDEYKFIFMSKKTLIHTESVPSK